MRLPSARVPATTNRQSPAIGSRIAGFVGPGALLDHVGRYRRHAGMRHVGLELQSRPGDGIAFGVV